MGLLLMLTLGGLAALGAYTLLYTVPGVRAVRVRNALLLEPSKPTDFEWMPPAVPPDFVVESESAGRVFAEAVKGAGVASTGGGDWPRALALASHLAIHAKDRGPIRDEPVVTYRRILEGYGYCSDFVKVYLAMLSAAGIFARQWSFSFDDFGGHGHTFVEVFDREHNRWHAIDVYNNFHPVDNATRETLSATAFHAALHDGRPITFERNGPGRLGFVEEAYALDYYQRGRANWYMWWGNAVLLRYAHPAVRVASHFSRALAAALAMTLGRHMRLRIFPSFERTAAGRGLMSLRTRFRFVGVAAAVLGIALVLEAIAWWARRGHF